MNVCLCCSGHVLRKQVSTHARQCDEGLLVVQWTCGGPWGVQTASASLWCGRLKSSWPSTTPSAPSSRTRYLPHPTCLLPAVCAGADTVLAVVCAGADTVLAAFWAAADTVLATLCAGADTVLAAL